MEELKRREGNEDSLAESEQYSVYPSLKDSLFEESKYEGDNNSLAGNHN